LVFNDKLFQSVKFVDVSFFYLGTIGSHLNYDSYTPYNQRLANTFFGNQNYTFASSLTEGSQYQTGTINNIILKLSVILGSQQ